MARFKIKLSDGRIIYPDDIERTEKIQLYELYEKGEIKLYCGCNECKTEYGIRKNTYAIYPKSMNGIHADWCPKSEQYKRKIKYNSGFKIDEENGMVHVHLSEILKNRNTNDVDEENTVENDDGIVIPRETDRKYPDMVQDKITVSAMVKKMNMYAFEHVAFSTQETFYLDAKNMCQKMYWVENKVTISPFRKPIAELDRIKDKCAFVYEMLGGIPHFAQEDKGDTIVRLQTTRSHKDKIVTIPVYQDALERALAEYENTYSTRDMEGKNIVFAGFRDRFAVYNLCFLLVNDFGLFSESLYEVQMYNSICNLINHRGFKEKGVSFYKPFEYGYGAYGDRYLEDGIIEFQKSNKKIIIEVYGRNDADYLEKKRIKGDILAAHSDIYRYVPWNAYLNEPIPEKDIENEIDRILSETEG